MREKIAADNDNKTAATESGNDGSSEDSNDSSSRESKDQKAAATNKDTNGDVNVAPALTNDGLAKLIANLTTTDAKCDWNGADQSLFRTLHKMYTTNYCSIALIMLTKTCKQVRYPDQLLTIRLMRGMWG